MLQVISPHLTIDRHAFLLHLEQYKRWLFRIRYACTYRHPNTLQKLWSHVPKLPSIPFLSSGGNELKIPRGAVPHAHNQFDFSWGTGPLVDSYTGMYYLNGMHVRMPGHESVEEYDEELKVHQWTKLRDLGDTNEYIHPVTYHRSLIKGWEPNSPMRKSWNRGSWSEDGKMRFWWYMDGEKEKCALPEWVILQDGLDDGFNFERKWYMECEKSEKTLDKLADVAEFGRGRDFLEVLDEKLRLNEDRPLDIAP
jgi:hypothetical protein